MFDFLFGDSKPIWDEIYVPIDEPIYSDTLGRQRQRLLDSGDRGFLLEGAPRMHRPTPQGWNRLQEPPGVTRTGMLGDLVDRFDAHNERAQQAVEQEYAGDQAWRAQQRAQAGAALQRLLGILGGARPTRDPVAPPARGMIPGVDGALRPNRGYPPLPRASGGVRG